MHVYLPLAIKLVTTALFVSAATLAGRRWGHGVSGWLIGLPVNSAPIALFIALGHGTRFATLAATATMAGAASQIAFALGYRLVAGRSAWPLAFVAGSAAFALSTTALQALLRLAPPLPLLAALAALSIAAGLPALPGRGAAAPTAGAHNLPLPVALATAFILLVSQSAAWLGPTLAGLLSPFPLMAAILAVFAHREGGPPAAVQVWRGLGAGMFGFAAFFLVLALALVPLGILPAFGLAFLACVAIQAASLQLIGPA